MRAVCQSIAFEALLLALLGAASAACGGDDEPGGGAADAAPSGGADASPTGPALAELGTELAEVLCPRLFDCCSQGDLASVFKEFEGGPPADAAGCVAAVAPILTSDVEAVARSVEAGRQSYDAARMSTCLERLADVACGDLIGQFEVGTYAGCEPPFTARVAVGGACAVDDDCQTAYCAGGAKGEPSTCTEVPEDGEECEDRCADGFHCDAISSSCIAQRPDGEACEADDECLSGTCVDPVCGPDPLCDGEG